MADSVSFNVNNKFKGFKNFAFNRMEGVLAGREESIVKAQQEDSFITQASEEYKRWSERFVKWNDMDHLKALHQIEYWDGNLASVGEESRSLAKSVA